MTLALRFTFKDSQIVKKKQKTKNKNIMTIFDQMYKLMDSNHKEIESYIYKKKKCMQLCNVE